METTLIKELTEVKTEIKYMSHTLWKVEKVLENQAVLLEKQSVANNRIKDLEESDKNFETRIRKLEDWQVKIIAVATILWSIGAFILNKIF